MSGEFEKIMGFFDLSMKEKATRLEDVFEESIEFFEKFKYLLENGSPEEKRQIFAQINKLQSRLQKESEDMQKVTGLNEQQLKEFSLNPDNFNEDEWGIISSAKKKLETQADEINVIVKGPEAAAEEKKKAAKKKKSTGKKKKRKDWVKS
ncbi:MAG: hypothetical protein SP1CHLAM54_17530 [Chlamydiia bacterium]|nr:hypothetical protein [Chlamydiia bacterium]MCH9616641.1 hypothetical protein [Chlamydiia bacterium]MCH9629372.1 hypothetical protein [Chlamydiia bacterium]